MTLRKGGDPHICRKKLYISIYGELALEEGLDLS
jgi:hypothetical protein